MEDASGDGSTTLTTLRVTSASLFLLVDVSSTGSDISLALLSCTTLPGVTEGGVECANGLCIAHKCRPGWLLTDGQCEGQKRRFWD